MLCPALTEGSYTVIFPFINQMVEELGITDNSDKVGFYSGLVVSALSKRQQRKEIISGEILRGLHLSWVREKAVGWSAASMDGMPQCGAQDGGQAAGKEEADSRQEGVYGREL